MATRPSSDSTKLAVIQNDIGYIKDQLKGIDDKVSENYVPLSRYLPIEKVVYGLVSLILVAVVGALISLVVNR